MDAAPRSLPPITETDMDNNLQFVEREELERTWKSTRRERLKHQEEKIWEQFCGEKDVVTSACTDDPYQFLEQIPDWKLKQLMELELEMLKKEEVQEEVGKGDAGDADSPLALTYDIHLEQGDAEYDPDNGVDTGKVVHINTDNQEKEFEPDDNKSDGLNTVRELTPTTEVPASPLVTLPPQETSVHKERKPTDNNIYCDKIKDLRRKIIDNITEFIECMDTQNILDLLPENLSKLKRHSTEFCARFSRNYIYPITRQMSDIKRHDSNSFPYAQHTHYQSQLVRIHSAHQHILQAFMIFSKNFSQSIMVEETINQLANYINTLRECDEVFIKTNAPIDVKYAKDIFHDEMSTWCNNLESCLLEYKERMDTVIGDSIVSQPKTETKVRKTYEIKSKNPLRRNPSKVYKQDMDAKLSMYSLNKTVSSIHVRSSRTCKSNKGKRNYTKKIQEKVINNQNNILETSVPKKIPSMIRPTMRHIKTSTARSAAVAHSDENIRTMVENIDMAKKSKDSTPKSKPRLKSANSVKSKHSGDKNPNTVQSISNLKADGDKVLCCTSQVTRHDPKLLSNHNDLKSPTESGKIQESCGQDVTQLLRKICGADPLPTKNSYIQGAKNAQLICINDSSPRHTTPELLKILDKTIEKKSPKPINLRSDHPKDNQLLQLNISEQVEAHLLDYRKKFLGHILTNPLYANTKFCKPWELVNRAAESILEDMISACAGDLQLNSLLTAIYKNETTAL